MKLVRTLLLGALFANAADPVWKPFDYFVGSWRGTSQGKAGAAKCERTYRLVLNDRFLEIRNKSTYAPQEKNPKGEVHEDWGLIGFDRMRKKFVLRQFHVEGYVNQYLFESGEDKRLIFTSESIENLPPDWRARETYRIVNENHFVETFELAAPGKDFEVYSETRFKRR